LEAVLNGMHKIG